VVPIDPAKGKNPSVTKRKGVQESIQIWVKLNSCVGTPVTDVLSKDGNEKKVTRTTYGGGKDGTEVVLVIIEGGGHTWPGLKSPPANIGKSADSIPANELIWEFFQRHPRK
jgi:polyhydroxybutyrate depolymerase